MLVRENSPFKIFWWVVYAVTTVLYTTNAAVISFSEHLYPNIALIIWLKYYFQKPGLILSYYKNLRHLQKKLRRFYLLR
jgi:hypothetical protein